ncbi:MAG: N-formylglutamate amidohydrolase [Planctomycetota bacterium]
MSQDENVLVRPGDPSVPLLASCEHASRAVPADVALGAPPELLDSHWGWDRWAEDTLLRFTPAAGIATVSARVSRLVLDVNRAPDAPTLIRAEAGGVELPGNRGLSPAEVAARVARFHTPYHAALDRELSALVARCGRERALLVAMHSFTPVYGEQDRDFEVGVLFDAHEGLAEAAARALEGTGLRARLNEPYSGHRGEIYSAARHGRAHGIAYFELELNQGLLEDEDRRADVAAALGRVLPALVQTLP